MYTANVKDRTNRLRGKTEEMLSLALVDFNVLLAFHKMTAIDTCGQFVSFRKHQNSPSGLPSRIIIVDASITTKIAVARVLQNMSHMPEQEITHRLTDIKLLNDNIGAIHYVQ